MYGLEAINESMGWHMAVLGISIVFLSLIVLALVISQIKNVLDFFGKKDDSQDQAGYRKKDVNESQEIAHPPVCPENIEEVAEIWAPLIGQLGETFMLRELYELAEENKFPHPHLTISRLREAGILVPGPEGTFSWTRA